MARPFNPERRAEAMSQAWRLRQRGLTVREIAVELGCHHSTVCRLLERVERRVLAELGEDAAAAKREQVTELRLIFAQAIQAWELSLEDAVTERRTAGRSVVANGQVFKVGDEVVTERRGQSGNPALLAQARGALADIRSLLGLDAAPKKAAEGEGEGEPPVLIAGVDLEAV